MRLFYLPAILLALSASLFAATDAEIQAAINRGCGRTPDLLMKQIKKDHTVRLTRGGFHDPVAKKVTFILDTDYVALLASEAHRRHIRATVEGIKTAQITGGPILGVTRVLLQTDAVRNDSSSLADWSAPYVGLILTADGKQLRPLDSSGSEISETSFGKTEHGYLSDFGGFVSYTPLYTSALYDMIHSHTWFMFKLPYNADRYTVTVISGDGHEKSKDFGPEVLH